MTAENGETEINTDPMTALFGRPEMLASLRSAVLCRPVDAQELIDPEHGASPAEPPLQHWLVEHATANGSNVATPVDGANESVLPQYFATDAPVGLSGLVEILERRQSKLLPIPASGAALRELLHLLSFRRSTAEDAAGRIWQSRFYPASGGTHCIEPLLHIHDAEGHPSGWFCQIGPRANDLRAINLPEAGTLSETVMAALRLEAPPSATIFAVADPEVLLARYPNGSSLLWRDAGAFLGIAQLCCCCLGLSATIAGIAGELSGRPSTVPPYVVGALGIGGGSSAL